MIFCHLQVFDEPIFLEFPQNFFPCPYFSAIFLSDRSGAVDGQFMGQSTGSHRLQPAAGALPFLQIAEQILGHPADGFIFFRRRGSVGFPHQFRALGIQKVFQSQLYGIADLFVSLHVIDAAFH